MSKTTRLGTPALLLAAKAGVAFTVHEYHHDPRSESYGNEAADALGLAAEQVFKTLVADVDGKLVVAVVPVAGSLDLKALAAAAGGRKAAMAKVPDAERATGYVVGGISPLGQKKRLPLFLDISALTCTVGRASAGKRGLEIELAPQDLLTLTDGRAAAIAAP
jgi:Cys-tRNA(Pro)/Cys-tRNA(Cys) deacylase